MEEETQLHRENAETGGSWLFQAGRVESALSSASMQSPALDGSSTDSVGCETKTQLGTVRSIQSDQK